MIQARICKSTLILIMFLASLNIAQTNLLSAEQQDEMIIVRIDKVTFTCYRYADGQKYPYFYPINGPISDESITTESSLPYPHHRSLWFACDRVNGGNYWQEGNEMGQIISKGPQIIENNNKKIIIKDNCNWNKPGEPPIISDERLIKIFAPSDSLRIIDFTIKLKALTNINILKTNHSLFSARMSPALSVNEGGSLLNANGKSGEKETAGEGSAWCDYYGERFEIIEGLAIFDSPQNIWFPSKWFTRDYGFFSPTNLYWDEESYHINKAESITFKYRVIVHAGSTEQANINKLYSSWIGD